MRKYVEMACPSGSGWAKQEPLGMALLAMARDLGPETRMPTVRAICSAFGVSTSTLNPVLRSLEQRGAVIRRHGSGIYVAPSIRQRTLGVVFGGNIFTPDFSPFWSLLLESVRQQAGGCGMRPQAYLDISGHARDLGGHRQLAEDIEARRLDGLLLLAPHHDGREAAELHASGIPLVVFGERGPQWGVTLDNDAFTRQAAGFLSAQDRRRVALMGFDIQRPRLILEQALLKAGVAVPAITDWSYTTWARHLPEAGTRENCAYQIARQQIAAGGPGPSALVSLDDTMTRGVITALQQAGLHPGRDLRIVSSAHTGSPVLDLYRGDITCIEFNPQTVVAAALGMLETLMDGKTPPANPVHIVPSASLGSVVPHAQPMFVEPEERGGTR